MRKEIDTIGTKMVPDDAYYGVHTERARENFPIPCLRQDDELIKSYLQIKKACAMANKEAGRWKDDKIPDAIIKACDDLYANFDKFKPEFELPAIQGGAGTSCNMNVNEVVANRAIEMLGGKKGDYTIVHPNDDINKSQSTNDTYPTAGHLAIIKYSKKLLDQLQEDIDSLERLADEHKNDLKMGRTQLEDAVPTTFGHSFHAYASAFRRDIVRINRAISDLMVIPMGGTAIGTGLNATPDYMRLIVPKLSEVTGLPLKQADDLIDAIQNSDVYVEVSNTLTTLAATLSKLSNDLRLMNSGPQDGVGEINLPRKQAGSSIMPNKVNPVIPEVCNQVCFQVIGHAATVALCADHGQLELNAWEPLSFMNIFCDLRYLTAALKTLNDNALTGLTVNTERARKEVEGSAEVATALAPVLGYEATTKLIKEALATGKPIRELVAGKIPEEEFDQLMSPQNFFVHKN